MKISFISSVLLVTLSSASFAASSETSKSTSSTKPKTVSTKKPTVTKPKTSSTTSDNNKIVINPDTLKTYLLKANTSILNELTLVAQAKDKVNIARGNVLPSLNIEAEAASLISAPTFIMSSVEMLMPFLLPSNWFDLKSSDNLLKAEEQSYLILELNEYASAYALYETIVGDMALRDVLQQQYVNLNGVQNLLEQQDKLGLASPTDLKNAQAQAQLAQAAVSQMDELITQETASFRFALGLGLVDDMDFEIQHVPASSIEGQTPESLITQVNQKAPESVQIRYLLASGKDQKWSAVFSFLNSAALVSSSSGAGHSATFSGLAATGSANLGFGYFPNIALTNDNIEQIKIQNTTLKLTEGQILETNLGSVTDATNQLALNAQAETKLQQVYDDYVLAYKLGLTDLLHVLTAQSDITTASEAKVKAQIDLDNLRINLHRIMLTKQFSNMPQCRVTKPEGLKGFFSPSAEYPTIDQACRR